MSSPKKCALVYDFDGTLAKGDCPQYGLPETLDFEVSKLWEDTKFEARKHDGDEILSYMRVLLSYSQKNLEALGKPQLRKFGQEIDLFEGVEDWFNRIDKFVDGQDLGLDVEHYVVSSGLQEMIEGTAIAKHFQNIYACRYLYDDEGRPTWPALAINYTTKTQYLFRINKGVQNAWDNSSVNQFVKPSERHVPFSRMIYFGDGATDIPSMKVVRSLGGYSIGVLDPNKWANEGARSKIEELIAAERVSYVAPADYSEESQLDMITRGLLRLFSKEPVAVKQEASTSW